MPYIAFDVHKHYTLVLGGGGGGRGGLRRE